MTSLDYAVLVVYFLAMAAIGLASMRKVKKQEDFFLGGRSFGKILQAFAAFGAGTGSQEPVATRRTNYTNGLSGAWGGRFPPRGGKGPGGDGTSGSRSAVRSPCPPPRSPPPAKP